jgi:hypothetical protein
MDDQDFSWLYNALIEAFADVSNPSGRQAISTQALNGEIYTRLRAMISSSRLREDSPLRVLFASQRRNLNFRFDQLRQHDKEKVATMFNTIRRERLEEAQDTDASLHELEMILTGMQASVNKMTDAAVRSETVREDIEKLDEFLSDH